MAEASVSLLLIICVHWLHSRVKSALMPDDGNCRLRSSEQLPAVSLAARLRRGVDELLVTPRNQDWRRIGAKVAHFAREVFYVGENSKYLNMMGSGLLIAAHMRV